MVFALRANEPNIRRRRAFQKMAWQAAPVTVQGLDRARARWWWNRRGSGPIVKAWPECRLCGDPMSDRGVGFSLRPSFEGTLSAARIPDDFFERIQHRVADGLFLTGRRARANYRVTSTDSQMLIFEAADFATAYAIGLNRVELRRTPAD